MKKARKVNRNKGVKTGPNNKHYLFKGDNISYITLHGWVRRHKVDPKKCEHCDVVNVKLQWANKSHEYKRNLNDWVRLCIPCHRKHDLDEDGNKRIDTKKFGICGGDRKNGKLTNEQIIEIYLSGLPQPEIAKKYNIRQSYVSRIKTKVRCARVTKEYEAKYHSRQEKTTVA